MHTDKGRKLINEDKLLELWVQAYNQTIRPKLMLRRMSFRTDEMRSKWQEMNLPEGMLWGGDCGANLTDVYLVPGSFEIYTSKPSAMLMTTGMVMPNENGEITLYQKFWNDDNDTKVVPKLIIYADLMNSGDSRQIEAAQRLINKIDKAKFANDPLYETLAALQKSLEQLNLQLYVVGACARDIAMIVLNVPASARRTIDIDVAIALDNWEMFDKVSELLQQNYFKKDPYAKQKFYYKGEDGTNDYEVDVVPFGPLDNNEVIDVRNYSNIRLALQNVANILSA